MYLNYFIQHDIFTTQMNVNIYTIPNIHMNDHEIESMVVKKKFKNIHIR